MTDFFNKLATDVKNITSNVESRIVDNVQTLNFQNDSFTISEIENRKCKIILTCESAQQLITNIEGYIKKINDTFMNSVDTLVTGIKNTVNGLTYKNMTEYFTNSKMIQDTYYKLEAQKQNAYNLNISAKIPVHVIIKGIDSKLAGFITIINIEKKIVNIEYTEMNGKTNSYIIDIGQLCIQGKDCLVNLHKTEKQKPKQVKQTGGILHRDNDIYNEEQTPDKNYKIICE